MEKKYVSIILLSIQSQRLPPTLLSPTLLVYDQWIQVAPLGPLL